MGALREASGFGLLAILNLCEARYLIRPGFIDLLLVSSHANFGLLSASLDQ